MIKSKIYRKYFVLAATILFIFLVLGFLWFALLSNQTISITGNVGIKNIDTQTATNWAFSLYETDKTESSQTNTFSWTNPSLYGICKTLLIK